jgi:hypothetical protein
VIQEQYSCDILAFISPIFEPVDDQVLEICRSRERQKNLLMIADTPGGSADAAYRIVRAIHRCYGNNGGEFILFVPRYCKSAGTIMALGGSRLIMSQEAELGPIDVQLRKDDEVGERTSGLTPHQALDTLAGETVQQFRRIYHHLRHDEETLFSAKLSAELASSMAVGLMNPIYEQMDPLRLGEVERFVRIAIDYGERIRSRNVKENAIGMLAAAYPSHGFVIDREEAEASLFYSVEKPIDELEYLAQALLNNVTRDKSFVRFIEKTNDNEESADDGQEEPDEKPRGRSSKRKSSSTRQNTTQSGE